ncbi:hypothetical protein [Flavobacterium solisilvae]|uniref:SprT-like domain-containing protein n=1 Tax=Flavobacterium solisilvae TaxID=1852019 RepID=A0ABX1QXV4_9FLAO|nr:hypothetical protein [Flavobacterium solisilvae]NMH25659.1 hypothetical protein [Flavobacterium solisilvae]
MKPYSEIIQKIETYHELGETIQAAEFLIEEYGIKHPNLKGFELREKAKPDYIMMTAEGNFGEKQIIRIPENTFQFELILMLNLIAHEMIHVEQKSYLNKFPDRNEREWQAYYEMLFHKVYPQVPNASTFHRKFFANKAFEYYNRMEKDGELQRKYASQKVEIEQLLATLE